MTLPGRCQRPQKEQALCIRRRSVLLSRATLVLGLGLSLLGFGCGSSSQLQPFQSGDPLPVAASFVDPTARLAGPVTIGARVYVAPFARIEADKGLIHIGDETDLQDNVFVQGDVFLGDRVLLAHGCTIKGPARLGATGGLTCFVGFNGEVDGGQVEPDAMVGLMARLGPGVILHSGMRILNGRNVTTQQEADDPTLGKVAVMNAADRKFLLGVLTVNLDLASGYARLQAEDPNAVRGIGPDPITPLHPEQFLPVLGGQPFADPFFRNRIVGEITMADAAGVLSSLMSDRDSLRADEGGPFSFGSNNRFDNEVTVHALEHSQVQIGRDCRFGLHSLIHGGQDLNTVPPEVTILGDRITVGSGAVVYRTTLGDGCIIGDRALLDGGVLPSGTVVPPRAIVVSGVTQGFVEW